MKPIVTNTWQTLKFLGNLQVNPSDNALAYVVSEANLEADAYDHNIWIYQKRKHFQLTSNNKAQHYSWLDRTTLIFHQVNEETKKVDVYQIATTGGEAQLWFSLGVSVKQIKVINNKQLLVLVTDHEDYLDKHKVDDEQWEAYQKAIKADSYYQEINQLPFYFNGGTFMSKTFTRLYVYDVEKASLKPISAPAIDIISLEINAKQNKALVLARTRSDVYGFENDLYELSLKNFRLRKLTQGDQWLLQAFYLKNTIVAIMKEIGGTFGMNQNAVLGQYHRKNKRFEVVGDPIYAIGNSMNSDVRMLGSPLACVHDDKFYFTLNVRDHSRLMQFDGKHMERVLDFEGSIDGFSFLNNKLIILGLKDQQAQALYHEDKQLSNHNKALRDYRIITPEAIEYEVDGRALKGWVLLPPKFNAKKKYPAILNIHGGPKTIYGEVYVHEMQVWANAGYVVMYTNPSGSDGQDNAFSDIRGKYGTVDYDDLMGFFQTVLQRYPNINPAKCGVTGGSYGGFMTNWIIGHTNRFACAITQRSISNWTSFYGVADIGYYFTKDQQQASLQKSGDIEKLWWHSPIKYLANMQTPTLIIHSQKDYRCPVEQAYQLFTGLKEKGVETKMILFNEENHDLSRTGKVKARQKRLDEMLACFNHYLK